MFYVLRKYSSQFMFVFDLFVFAGKNGVIQIFDSTAVKSFHCWCSLIFIAHGCASMIGILSENYHHLRDAHCVCINRLFFHKVKDAA